MKQLAGVALGSVAAFAIACGAASKPATMAQTTTAAPQETAAGGGTTRQQLERLDAAITADFERLGVARPATAMAITGCEPGVSCATALRQGTEAPEVDPMCRPGPSETCKDSCKLGDSICANAAKICTIAGDLGGSDAFANETCASAKTSCDVASERCCGCV